MSNESSTENGDPASLLNKTVKLHSITAKPELNNLIGQVISYNSSRDRYNVQLPTQSTPISLKATNLSAPSISDRAKFHVQEAKMKYNEIKNNPMIKELGNRTVQSFQDKLPSAIQPKQALIGLSLLLAFLVYKIGVTKVFMMVSLLSMLPAVCLPDLLGSSRYENVFDVIRRKFPFRFRESLVQMTGYTKLTNKMAMGIYIAICLLCGYIIITPTTTSTTSSATTTPVTTPGSFIDDEGVSNGNIPRMSEGTVWTMDQVYKMGFDDASNDEIYGTSLPPNHESMTFSSSDTVQPRSRYLDEDMYVPPPPPPPSTKSKFGMGTMMSLFALGRAVKDLGFTPDNRFDFTLFMANVQHMEKWRMAMMGVCLYRVVSAFL